MVLLLLRMLVWPLMFFVKELKGIENLPKKQFIIAANHSSYIDPVLLIYLCARYRNVKLRVFATSNPKWNNWWWNMWWNYVGAIRINGSLQKGLDAAQEGDTLGIFPEGMRTMDGRIHDTKHTGLGVLALKTRLPVVPVTMNTFWWWNKYQKLPNFKRNIKITIGKPIQFKYKDNTENAKKVVKQVMKEIKKNA